jgi:hypothetical protein
MRIPIPISTDRRSQHRGQLKDIKRFEAALFVLRKRAANLAAQQPGLPFYVPWTCLELGMHIVYIYNYI